MFRNITGSRNILLNHGLHALIPVRFARIRRIVKLSPPSIEKRLDCVMFGLPNVGKSVLLNSLVKHKLAATSRKRHTTRGEIMGVYNHRNTQLVFFDTPGFVSSVGELRKEAAILRGNATETVDKADIVLLVVDAARVLNDNAKFLFGEMVSIAVRKAKKDIILVLNKVDLVEPKAKLLDLTRELVSLINGVKLGVENAHLAELDTTTFMISALNNDGVLDLKNYLIRIAEKKPWLLAPEDGYTSLEVEDRVEELLLEKLLEQTHEEIPYQAQIRCTSIKAEDDDTIRVDIDIVVPNDRHMKIIIGSQGRTLVKLRQDLCVDLEKMFKKKVLAYLWVKVGVMEIED